MVGELIAGLFGKVIDRAWPDPTQKAAAALELEKMRQAGEFKELDAALQMAQMQATVNQVEAASPDRFVAGWRPFIGWVTGSALAWHYIGAPLLVWVATLAGKSTAMPEIAIGDLLTLMLGMLGLGAMRTTEKVKGVA